MKSQFSIRALVAVATLAAFFGAQIAGAQGVFNLYTSLVGTEVIADQVNPTGASFTVNVLDNFITGGTTGIVQVTKGGTGRATLTNHGVLIGAGTTAITQLGVGASGTILAGVTSADPAFTASPSGLTSIEATTVQAGLSGTAGTVSVFPTTAASGKTSITATANSGDTTTTINTAAQGGTRAYTIPDQGGNATVLMTVGTVASDGLVATPLAITGFKNNDGTTLVVAASAGKFGITSTPGTVLQLLTEAANSNTKTDIAQVEYVVPLNYVSASNITVTANCDYTLGGGTVGTHTLAAAAYLTANAGTQGTTLIATSAQTVPASAGDVTFTITGATLVPGSRLILTFTLVIQDTGGSNITAHVNSVRLS